MGNNALNNNAGVWTQPNLGITRRGSDWYFTVCAIMGFSAILVLATSFRKPQSTKLFHYITTGILAIATISYFTMAIGLGQDPIPVEFVRGGKVAAAGTREIFWVRYVDWFCTTPLLLLDLLLTAAVPFPLIIGIIIADWIMIICGLVGALISTRYKWAYWTFGMAAFLYVAWGLLWEGRRHANALGGNVKKTYWACGILTIGIWFLYPIAWGVSEGGNDIHPDSEAVFYGILDLIAKPVFSALLLWGHRTIDPATLGLYSRKPGWSQRGDGIREKHPGGVPPAGDGVHNGVTNGTQAEVQHENA